MRNVKRDLTFVWNIDKSFVVWNLLYHVAEQGFQVFIGAFFIRIIINGLQSGADARWILLFLLLSCGIYFVKELYFAWYLQYLEPVHRITIREALRSRIYETAGNLSLERYESAEFYSDYEKALQKKEQSILDYIDNAGNLVASVCGAAVLIALFTTLDAAMMVFAAFPVAGALLIGSRMNELIYQRDAACVESRRKEKYVARSFAAKEYAPQLRTTAMVSVLFHYYEKAIRQEIGTLTAYGRRMTLVLWIHMTIGFLLPFLGSCFYLSYQVFVTRRLQIGDFASLSLAILNFAQMLLSVVYGVQELKRSHLFLSNVTTFLQLPSKRDRGVSPKAPDPSPRAAGTSLETAQAEAPLIAIKNLSYRYPGSEVQVLSHISLTVNRGEKIAIVGYNGAGKTTLIHILLKLLPCAPNTVFFCGQDLAQLNEAEYQRMWGAVLQDFRIPAMPLCDYLSETGGRMEEALPEDSTAHAMEQALRRADLTENVPPDYSRELTKEFCEDGIVLSRGQQQRLAFARCFYRQPDFAVLDEPSSALDPLHEQQLLEEILHKNPGQTLLLISHRLSCTAQMDRIYFMKHGEIVESGTHQELMCRDGEYAQLFRKQASHYVMKEGEV